MIINKLTKRTYQSVDLLNPELIPDTFHDKNIVLNLKLRDDQGIYYNIEIAGLTTN